MTEREPAIEGDPPFAKTRQAIDWQSVAAHEEEKRHRAELDALALKRELDMLQHQKKPKSSAKTQDREGAATFGAAAVGLLGTAGIVLTQDTWAEAMVMLEHLEPKYIFWVIIAYIAARASVRVATIIADAIRSGPASDNERGALDGG